MPSLLQKRRVWNICPAKWISIIASGPVPITKCGVINNLPSQVNNVAIFLSGYDCYQVCSVLPCKHTGFVADDSCSYRYVCSITVVSKIRLWFRKLFDFWKVSNRFSCLRYRKKLLSIKHNQRPNALRGNGRPDDPGSNPGFSIN